MKKILLTMFLFGVLGTVTAQETQPPLVLKDVKYVKDGTADQTLDFYWATQKPTATILFIHGGSLVEIGERRTSDVYKDVCKPFVAAGYGCATMDYRLAPTHKWAAMPEDVASAIVTPIPT